MFTKPDMNSVSRHLANATTSDILHDCTLAGRLTIATEGDVTISFSPFDYINSSAKIAIVGITPGRQQATKALCRLREGIASGEDFATASASAKAVASFAGSMRSNLTRMFDHVGLNSLLGIETCAHLFGPSAHLVHHTSVLRYPVFLNSQDYSGTPSIDRYESLRAMYVECFLEEMRILKDIVWVPIGRLPRQMLMAEAAGGRLKEEAVLCFPHASGANAERIAYFLGRKEREGLSSKTNARLIDEQKALVIAKVQHLTSVKLASSST